MTIHPALSKSSLKVKVIVKVGVGDWLKCESREKQITGQSKMKSWHAINS